jgi:hypothetical protein
MTKREAIHKELNALYGEGLDLATALGSHEAKSFQYDYQCWYTKALKAVASLAPDRHSEFRGYYEVNPGRKSLGYGTYVIQDFLMNVVPNAHRVPNFDALEVVVNCFLNQLAILKSIGERVDSVLSNIEGELHAEIQDNEIIVARQLAKFSARAAGALAGVVIEGHLQKVAQAHGTKIGKSNPTIADLNDPLKAASVIDIPAWRKISFLADLRNLCSHKKDTEPTKEQVEELIQGAEWLTKNVF